MDNRQNNDESSPPLFSDDKAFQDFEFDSFAEFDDIGANCVNSNSVAGINVEEYAFQELDLDAKYRSIQSINPSVFSVYSSPSLNSMAPPQLSNAKSNTHTASRQLLTKAPLPVVVKPSTKPINVPEQPFFVAPTQFASSHDLNTLISMVEHDLSNVIEVSYEFYHQKCRWECVYLCGPTRSKFEFNVYKSGNESYIIEGNRLCGDSFPFSTIFRALREKFCTSGITKCPPSVLNFQCVPLLESSVELSPSEINDAVAPILAMAASGKCESMVNAAQILCDLSLQESMRESISTRDCVMTLVKLTRVEFDYCNQHAICALANLSSSRSCREFLLNDDSFLQQLLHLCADGSYNTSEMRRECARLLANVCSSRSGAMRIVELVGEDNVSSWVESVDGLKDERLRLHATRAREALQPCLV